MNSNSNGYVMHALGTATYRDAAEQTRLFSACNPVAGVAPGTALVTTLPFILHNPVGSGKRLVLLAARVGFISGTLGAGSVQYGVNAQATAPTGGTALSANSALIGSGAVAVGKPYQGATLSAVPTPLGPAFQLASLQTLATDLIDGQIVLSAGQAFSMVAVAAAGTSPLVQFGLTWEEV